MTGSKTQRNSPLVAPQPRVAPHTRRPVLAQGRTLRPSAKVLPEHARGHNRALVLQTLYGTGEMSRADVARETGLTRVTVSDLVAELIGTGLVEERGQREGSRPGKPATLIDINRTAHQIIGIDLAEASLFRAAVLDLDGEIVARYEIPRDGSTGEGAIAKVVDLATAIVAAATAPILGVGVGSPGIVDLDGTVLAAPNLGWHRVALQQRLEAALRLPVLVANDANAAVLAEYGFGGSDGDIMLVTVGHGVGAGLIVGGNPLYGGRFAAGEIGHVVVGTDGGSRCACGKTACLETWLATPRIDALLADIAASPLDDAAKSAARETVLRAAGERLGIALAPVVGALNLSEIVLSGPTELLDGPLAAATIETLRRRTMAEFHGDLTLRMTTQGQDIVLRGAAVMVLQGQLGVS